MFQLIVNRLVGMLSVMFILLVIVFVIARVIPGDPAGIMLGPDATPEDIAQLRTELGLDEALLDQFLLYASGILHGDIGHSIFLNAPVTELLWQRAEPTLLLALFSLAIAVLVAVPAGIIAAYWRGSIIDHLVSGFAILGASVPSFWLGLMFMQIFAMQLGWFPTSGYGGPHADFWTRLNYLALPSLTLGLTSSALISRFTRSAMLDVLQEDFVRTARSKGMSEFGVVMKHALKNALVPIFTVIGITAALLVSGAIVTETVFNLPGLGNLVVSAVLRRDYPVIQGTLLIVAGIYVIFNLIVDLLYLAIDPRVRY